MNTGKCSAHYTPVEWGRAATVLVVQIYNFVFSSLELIHLRCVIMRVQAPIAQLRERRTLDRKVAVLCP